jgi:nuclear transport factor 2 (NTF2) superfamily protein
MNMNTTSTSPIKPPFTAATAKAKVQLAEDAWNTRNPEVVAKAYSEDSDWRNRDHFFIGRAAIQTFLADKWQKELHYALEKELWAWTENRISVRFIYEWQDSVSGHWFRTHGNEHWEFDENGLMKRRDMSANDIRISADDRQVKVRRAK